MFNCWGFLFLVSTPQINSNNVSIRPGPVSGKASHDQAPAYYLRLNGLPKTAIQNDIWRELHKARATGVKKGDVGFETHYTLLSLTFIVVQLLYHQMEPNGSALLTFGSAEARAQAQKTLRSHSSSISGSPITSIFSSRETPTHRGRGAAGRAETLAGPYGGSGPDGGIVERATHVLVSGTPGKVSPGMFRGKTCDGFDLVKNTPASFNVIKMQE